MTWLQLVSLCLALCLALALQDKNTKVQWCAGLWILTALLWLQAALDLARFQSAMKLRLAACQQLQRGHLPLAAELLESALNQDPHQLDIAADLAEIYLALGQPEPALKGLARAISQCPRRPGPLARAHRQRGQVLLQIGRPAAARQDLRTARSWAPEDAEVRGLLRRAEALMH